MMPAHIAPVRCSSSQHEVPSISRLEKLPATIHPWPADEPLLQNGSCLRKPQEPNIPTNLHRAWNIATACGRVYGQQEFAIGQFQYAPFAVQAGPPQAPLPLDIRRPLCMQ